MVVCHPHMPQKLFSKHNVLLCFIFALFHPASHASTCLTLGHGSLLCLVKNGARLEADWDAPDVTRAEEEAIQQAMQDAMLREQAQADRERTQQVPALSPSCSADLSPPIPFCAFFVVFVCVCTHCIACVRKCPQ